MERLYFLMGGMGGKKNKLFSENDGYCARFEHLVEIRKQTQIMNISCQEGTEFFPSEILQFDNLRFFRLWGGTLKTFL